MVKKVLNEIFAFVKRIKGRVIASWEARLPSRDTLLMSLWKSGEKDLEIRKRKFIRNGSVGSWGITRVTSF